MNNLTQDQRYYCLTSFYTSAFLFAKGVELANIDKVSNPRRAKFVFVNSPEIEILLHEFNFAKEGTKEVLVDSRKFITAIRQLKEKLYQEESV